MQSRDLAESSHVIRVRRPCSHNLLNISGLYPIHFNLSHSSIYIRPIDFDAGWVISIILGAICPLMGGYDRHATTPTGSAGAGYFTLLMVVVWEVAADDTPLIRVERFLKDPVTIALKL